MDQIRRVSSSPNGDTFSGPYGPWKGAYTWRGLEHTGFLFTGSQQNSRGQHCLIDSLASTPLTIGDWTKGQHVLSQTLLGDVFSFDRHNQRSDCLPLCTNGQCLELPRLLSTTQIFLLKDALTASVCHFPALAIIFIISLPTSWQAVTCMSEHLGVSVARADTHFILT